MKEGNLQRPGLLCPSQTRSPARSSPPHQTPVRTTGKKEEQGCLSVNHIKVNGRRKEKKKRRELCRGLCSPLASSLCQPSGPPQAARSSRKTNLSCSRAAPWTHSWSSSCDEEKRRSRQFPTAVFFFMKMCSLFAKTIFPFQKIFFLPLSPLSSSALKPFLDRIALCTFRRLKHWSDDHT